MISHAFNSDVVEIPTEGEDTLNATQDDDSDNYEELSVPTSPSHVIEGLRYASSSSEHTDADFWCWYSDSSYLLTDEEAEEEEEGVEWEEGEEGEETSNGTISIHENGGVNLKESFAKLQENPFSSDTFLLDQSCERARWRVLELEETKQTVERELAEAIDEQESLEKQLEVKYQDFCHRTGSLGISEELWDAYHAFCESMEPEAGSTNGFSITCDEKHDGSYVRVS